MKLNLRPVNYETGTGKILTCILHMIITLLKLPGNINLISTTIAALKTAIQLKIIIKQFNQEELALILITFDVNKILDI